MSEDLNVYGFCPTCGAPGVSRERRPNGNDTCENKHKYPSKNARPTRPSTKVKLVPPVIPGAEDATVTTRVRRWVLKDTDVMAILRFHLGIHPNTEVEFDHQIYNEGDTYSGVIIIATERVEDNG